MGVGQRLARRAAHVGGVIVVDDAAAVRDVLVPVYAALGISWDPAVTGAVEDEIGRLDVATVRDAVLRELAKRRRLTAGTVGPEIAAAARTVAHRHVATE